VRGCEGVVLGAVLVLRHRNPKNQEKLMKVVPLVALAVCLLLPRISHAQSYDDTRIGGQWFLNFRVGKEGDETVSRFGVDRAYINIRHRLSERWSGRITPDASLDREGDGEGDLKVRLKYAYIDFAFDDLGIFTAPHVEFGLAHRPWLDFEEHLNYYRYQGTMFTERNGLFNSADYGITLFSLIGGTMAEDYREKVNSAYPGRYGSLAVGVYNGGGYHGIERNTNKSLEGRLTLRPLPDVLPGLQFTYHGIYGTGNQVDDTDWTVNLLFVSWESQHLVVTAQQYWGRGDFKGNALDDLGDALRQDGFSLFGEYRFTNPHVSVLARYDRFDDTPDVDGGESDRIIGGVAYHLEGHSKIVVDYDVESRDGFDTAAERYLKVGVEFSF